MTSVVLYPASLMTRAQKFDDLLAFLAQGTFLIVAPPPSASCCRIIGLVTAIQRQGVPVAFVSEDALHLAA